MNPFRIDAQARKGVDGVTDRQQEYFQLFEQGYTVTEIARMLGKAKSTVSATLTRAKEMPRKRDGARATTGTGYGKYIPCPFGRDCFSCTAPDCYADSAYRYNILPTDRAMFSELGGGAQ